MARSSMNGHSQDARHKVVAISPEIVGKVSSTDFPGHFHREDHSWDIDKFKQAFQVQLHQNEQFDASFSLVHIDASIANAFRRILLAEIPTLAIEHVYIVANDSVISDEVLAARLGLIPLTGPLDGLRWLKGPPVLKTEGGEDVSAATEANKSTDDNTIELSLKISCRWKPGMKEKKGDFSPDELYERSSVYAADLEFLPQARQVEVFGEKDRRIRPVNPRILIAKLRPGEEIELTCHALKGVGADHAKFSPVATASYRLLPVIDIIRPIFGDDARKFAECFPPGVIGVAEVTRKQSDQAGSKLQGQQGKEYAFVKDAFQDTISRECLRHDKFKDRVKLGRVRDHFIFSIESTGQYPSDELFIESVKVLKGKCLSLKNALQDIMR